MAEPPQTDVSRPSALPTASLLSRGPAALIDVNSDQYLDTIEEEWNKKVDVEVETLVDGMVDLVNLASVGKIFFVAPCARASIFASCLHFMATQVEGTLPTAVRGGETGGPHRTTLSPTISLNVQF